MEIDIEQLIRKFNELKGNEQLNVIVRPGSASPEEVGNLLSEISKLYELISGSGIEFRPEEIRESNSVSYDW